MAAYLERWLRDYCAVKVSPKTAERYTQIVRLHLTPTLGHHQLTKLRPLHIQEAYTFWLQGGRRDGEAGGLSVTTVLHHHRVLHLALRQAVRWQLLAVNPADAVQPPRKAQREMSALDEDETAKLLEAAVGSDLYAPILVAVTTGLRRGELLALRWQDVDLERGTLSVNQTIEQTAERGIAFKEPKTAKSRRLISLGSLTVETLRRHRASQNEARLLLGNSYVDGGLVFPAPAGSVWNPRTFSSAFYRLTSHSGVPRMRFHDLRHSHATQLLVAGVHVKVVSERLGHSTAGITLDTYSHVLPGIQEEAAARIDSAIRGAIMRSSMAAQR